MTSDGENLQALVQRLRSRADFEAPGPNCDPETTEPQLTWTEMVEIVDLLSEAADVLERVASEALSLREALCGARDVLAAFAKQAGVVPAQNAYSSTMTDGEKNLWQAVSDIDAILSATPERSHAEQPTPDWSTVRPTIEEVSGLIDFGGQVKAGSSTFICKARSGGDPAEPQDCDWPYCGCDSHAEKVISALVEEGWTRSKAEQPTCSTWSVDSHLDTLSALEPNWDDEGAAPLSPAVVAFAKQCATGLAQTGVPKPTGVVPTNAGTIMFEWHDADGVVREFEVLVHEPKPSEAQS